jgi:hypothetical protein
MVNMNWELKKAYELSINDFEIALRHTSFWEFSRRSYLTKRIKFGHLVQLVRALP